MLSDIKNFSINLAHKMFVTRGENLSPPDENLLILVTEKIISYLIEINDKRGVGNLIENNSKEFNMGLQVLYRILVSINEFQNEITEDFIRKIFDFISMIANFCSNLPTTECKISASLTIVTLLKIKYGEILLNMTDKALILQASDFDNNLLRFYLTSVFNIQNISFSLSLYLALLNSFTLVEVNNNRLILKIIDFISDNRTIDGDISILKSIFFLKLSNIIFVNRLVVNNDLELTERLFNHCLENQFVKQTQIRANTIQILSETLRIHLGFCKDCQQYQPCQIIDRLVRSIFCQSWNLPGKFSFLNVFIRIFSADVIRNYESNIDFILLQTTQQYSLSTYAIDTLISLIVMDKGTSLLPIKLIVDIFRCNDKNFVDIQSIRVAVCESLIPKLIRENSGKICDILKESLDHIDHIDKPNTAIVQLVLCCAHQLLFVNSRQKIDRSATESILNLVLDDKFVARASVENDELIRMQLFSILCKQISRQKESQSIAIWDQIYRFLINNLSGSTNKLRHHFVSCFRTFLKAEILKNFSNLQSMSTQFVLRFLRYLIDNLYPGASFYKRSSILVFLELLMKLISENQLISQLLPMSCENVPVLVKTLIYFLTDTFQENRSNASHCFVYIVNSVPINFQYFETLKQIALDKSQSSNPHDCSVADALIKTLIKTNDHQLSPLEICKDLIERLENQCTKIKTNKDLIDAAMQAPMYSTLFCIRQLIEEFFKEIISEIYLTRIIELCYQISSIIFPFIASGAPEGCLPEEMRHSFDSVFMEHNAEYLTICCWRSCREISLILGCLAANLVDRYPEFYLQIKDISHFFFFQITTVTHKGAFESLSDGFEILCKSLWRSKTQDLSNIPRDFVNKSVDVLLLNEDLCSTRRSAGLPHLFVTLITSEPSVDKQFPSLTLVMNCLTSILSSADSSQLADQKRIIHIFNILRLLFKESSLSNQIFPYTFTSLKYAVQFFTSNNWPLRNSATLLYCALIERIFGPSKTVKCENKYNKLNSKLFFNRYPDMYEYIVKYVEECDKNQLSLEISTKIYPILIILARLVPETNDYLNITYDLSLVKEKITRYLHSSVWIIRVSAAKAIAALSLGDSFSFETLQALIDKIIISPKKHNFIHGSIKTIRYIFEDLLDNLFISEEQWITLQNRISDLWNRLSPIILSLSDNTQCPIEFIDLFEFLLSKSRKLLSHTQIEFHHENIDYLWQVKLLIISCCNSENIDANLKNSIIQSLQCTSYLIRKELLTMLCGSETIVRQYFSQSDFPFLLQAAQKESHLSVDFLWIKFIDLFLSMITIDDSSSILSLLSFLMENLSKDRQSIRSKKLSSLIELFGGVLNYFSDKNLEINNHVDFYTDLIIDYSVYESDIEIRNSCARSMFKSLKCLRKVPGNFSRILEILLIQLNDEDAELRNWAGKSFAEVLGVASVETSIPFHIQTTVFKDLGNHKDHLIDLLNKTPLGFSKKILKEKNSVFDSEELNFFYDFLDVHNCLTLNRDGSKLLIENCPFDELLNESSKFVRSYQKKLLAK